MNYPAELVARIVIKQGDIIGEDVDAIVNAANPGLLGGGGVDGAIHCAAGPGLLQECRTLGGCQHGEARITGGYNLKARYIIHTPGPVYKGGNKRERIILTESYYNSMRLAKEHNLLSISFPAISTGIYGYPKEEACEVAVTTVLDFMKNENFIIDVYFVLFDRENTELYTSFLSSIKNI